MLYSFGGRGCEKAGNELYDFYAPHFQKMLELEYYIPTSLFVLLRFHRWQDILAIQVPYSQMTMTTVLWHYARAMAFAALIN